MAIKWTVKMAINHLQTLTNPFASTAIQRTNQRPVLAEVMNRVSNNGGTTPPQEIIS